MEDTVELNTSIEQRIKREENSVAENMAEVVVLWVEENHTRRETTQNYVITDFHALFADHFPGVREQTNPSHDTKTEPSQNLWGRK